MRLFPYRLSPKNHNRPLCLGMIGLGRISDIHIQAFSHNKHVRIGALADISKDTVMQKAVQLGINKFSTDYRSILRDPSIDVVDVLLPHYLHARVTREA